MTSGEDGLEHLQRGQRLGEGLGELSCEAVRGQVHRGCHGLGEMRVHARGGCSHTTLTPGKDWGRCARTRQLAKSTQIPRTGGDSRARPDKSSWLARTGGGGRGLGELTPSRPYPP